MSFATSAASSRILREREREGEREGVKKEIDLREKRGMQCGEGAKVGGTSLCTVISFSWKLVGSSRKQLLGKPLRTLNILLAHKLLFI